ncbi:MFS transporter, partial [Acinetobacter baumannii]
ATIVFLNTLPVWLFKEPQHSSHASRELKLDQQNLVLKIKAYLRYFSQNKELRSWLMVLITFKVADGLAGPLLKPLMVDMGLSFTQIGVYI